MVIPKVHSQTILDLPEKDLGLLFEAVKEVSLLIKKAFSPRGLLSGLITVK